MLESTAKVPDSEDVDPSDVKGSFKIGALSGKFTGLSYDQYKTDNVWYLDEKGVNLDEGSKDFMGPEFNFIEVLDVKDDEGYPFLCFHWLANSRGPFGGDEVWVVAKRDTGKKWKSLSETERDRLGMDVTQKKLMKRAKKDENRKKGEQTDEEESESASSDSDDDSEDESDAEGDQVGKKRPAEDVDSEEEDTEDEGVEQVKSEVKQEPSAVRPTKKLKK